MGGGGERVKEKKSESGRKEVKRQRGNDKRRELKRDEREKNEGL